MDIESRARKIKCLLCDVDGTLTDASFFFTSEGDKRRTFNMRDGLGLYIFKKAGFKVGFVTGDNSSDTKQRAKMFKLDFEYYDCMDKKSAIEDILNNSSLKAEELAFIGDDLIDMPAMKRVGLAVAVADGVKDLDSCAHYRTKAKGGMGAVRELIELILKSQGLWGKIVADFSL